MKKCLHLMGFMFYCTWVLSNSRARAVPKKIPINWTRDGVAMYNDSNPLEVTFEEDFLQFNCDENDRTGLVYVVREDVYRNISGACSSGGIVAVQIDSLCIPDPIQDCALDRLEERVDGDEERTLSCEVPSFRPGMFYYLTNFPKNDNQRCLFSLPLRVCSREGCPSTEMPSPSYTTLLPRPSNPAVIKDDGIGNDGEKFKSVVSTVTTTIHSRGSALPTFTPTTTNSSAASSTIDSVLLLCLSFYLFSFLCV